jgi:hypothetical protein
VSYLVVRGSAESGSASVLASVFAIFGFVDMPIVYMSNRWFRTNHPQPMIGTPNLNSDMQKVLLWNMLAFVLFSLLIAWFRYDLERTSQKINALHVKKAARGSMAMTMLAPAMLLFADDKLLQEKMIQHRYMVIGYLAVWTVYIGYLLFLFTKLQRLKREGAEVGL